MTDSRAILPAHLVAGRKAQEQELERRRRENERQMREDANQKDLPRNARR